VKGGGANVPPVLNRLYITEKKKEALGKKRKKRGTPLQK